MSALGGIYGYNDKRVDPRVLVSLGTSLDRLGPDGGREVYAEKVGFTFRAFHINRESRLEAQPYVTEDGIIVTWDGRLDNREDLFAMLRRDLRSNFFVTTDVEIVAASYRRWGTDCSSKLIGDFALALWDRRNCLLLLARDPVGVKPLYYHVNRHSVLWASDLTALIDIAGAQSLEVDEDYVAGFLSFGKDTARTPFTNFKAVRPGHVVTVNREGVVAARRFWKLDPSAEIRMSSDKDYEERFRELFEEAVRCRLRSDKTVVSELSGGLDSSSIVCVADRLLKNGNAQAPNLETVSYISDECPSSDERKFIRYVEEHIGRQSNYIRQEDFPFLTPLPHPSRISTINPFLTNFGYQIALKELMESYGARVRLTGVGGDELLHSVNDPTPELAELLANFKLNILRRRLHLWGKLLREPYGKLFWSKALLPNLPLRLRATFRDRSRLRVPDWMNKDFVSRTRLRERNVGTPDMFGFKRATGRDQSIGFLSVVNVLSLGHHAEVCEHDVTYPYFHRPLVEFLCAVPFEQLLRPGESRSLMRRSLNGILPPHILRRKGKGNPREIVSVDFERQWPNYSCFFVDPLVARYGFVELEPLKEAFNRARHGFVAEASRLVAIITLEVWLRLVEERKKLPTRACAEEITFDEPVLVG